MSFPSSTSSSPRLRTTLHAWLRERWATHRALTAVGLAMLPVLAACLVGLLVDPRLVTGMPAWLKPAKFAVSVAIYTLTLAWLLPPLATVRPRLVRFAGDVVAAATALEIVLIVFQAARGHGSHFNVGTRLDSIIFGAMGITILALWIASLALVVALFRTRLGDRVMTEAFRWGLAISVAGASVGGVMTRPTHTQLETLQRGANPQAIGAHTVGAPDGGRVVPGVGWSAEHGDLRVSHFLGLHALQLLPLLAWLLGRRRPALPTRNAVALVRLAAAAWLSMTLAVLVEALRGISVTAPDAATLAWLAFTAGAAAVAARFLLRGGGQPAAHPHVASTVALHAEP